VTSSTNAANPPALQRSLPGRALDLAVYCWLEVSSWILCLLPGALVYRVLVWPLAWAIYLVVRLREPRANRRRRGVLRNLRIAFGRDLPLAALRRLAWGYSQHVALLVLESLRMRLLGHDPLRWIDTRELEQLRPLVAEGRGVIFVTGHVGMWEYLNFAAAGLGKLQVVSRPAEQPGLERWIQTQRDAASVDVRPKHGGLWGLRKTLQRGELAGLVADENARTGIHVPYFGVLAASSTSPAQLQRVSRAPLVVITTHRQRPGHARVHVWRVLHHDASEGRLEHQRRVTAEVMAGLEQAVRRYPTQVLWGMRRWATRPKGEELDPDGLPPRITPALPPAPTPVRSAHGDA
jgi:Kdo2-lipid IVA lauroyltransferase/acyltransferase